MAIINFIVTVPDNTPEETIYITGNHDELNNWDPAGIPLAPSEDNTHSVEIELPEGTELEFKFTRGTSASMEADEDFEEIESRVLTVEDDEEISCTVSSLGTWWAGEKATGLGPTTCQPSGSAGGMGSPPVQG